MVAVIEQLYQDVEIHYVAGDALRFKAIINHRDPDDPGTDEDPNMIPFPLEGYTVAAEIRKTFKKDSLLIATFVVELDDDEDNWIWVYLPAEQSILLRGHTSAVWDLQITDDLGDPLTIMGGAVRPKGDSTRV